MVTSVTNVQKTKNGHDYTYYEFTGLSTDTKPTTGVFNGSTFIEMDTSKVFMFDGTTMQWKEI